MIIVILFTAQQDNVLTLLEEIKSMKREVLIWL